jgi:hypothetical protein
VYHENPDSYNKECAELDQLRQVTRYCHAVIVFVSVVVFISPLVFVTVISVDTCCIMPSVLMIGCTGCHFYAGLLIGGKILMQYFSLPGHDIMRM